MRRLPGMSLPKTPQNSSRVGLGLVFAAVAVTSAFLFLPATDRDPASPLGGALAPARERDAEVTPVSAAPAERIGQAPAASPAGLYGAAPGTTFTFRYEDRNTYRFTGQEDMARPAETHVEATVALAVLDRRDAEVLVRATMPVLQFLDAHGHAFVGEATAERFAAAAKEPTLLRLGIDGGISCYRFDARLDGEQRNFLRGMLSAFVFTGPGDAATEWTAQELDTTGVYEARYARQPAGAGELRLRRSKVRYVSMHAQPQVLPHEPGGQATATFSTTEGWLTAAELDERLVCNFGLLDLQVHYQRQAALQLSATDRGPVPSDAAALWAGDWSAPSGEGEQVRDRALEQEEKQWQKQLAGVDVAQLLAQLREVLAAEPVDHKALDDVFVRLQWLAKFDARAVGALAELLQSGQLDGSAANVALGALGAAGFPEAQRVLLEVRSNAQLPAALRDAAAMAMLQIQQPVPELLQSLAAAANDRDADGQCAMLTLGALAPRSRDPIEGGDPVARLLAMEGQVGSGEGLAVWLRAVGNSGVPAALAIAERHFGNQDAQIRAAACDSVRRVETAPALQFLLERGLVDPAPEVRRTAITALARRAEAAAALRNVAIHDVDFDVRAAALSAMAEGPLDAADRAVLAQLAAGDAEERVREIAARLLRGE